MVNIVQYEFLMIHLIWSIGNFGCPRRMSVLEFGKFHYTY
jgi:hypothetical protein